MQFRFDIHVQYAAATSYERLALDERVYPCWVVSHILRGNVQTETRGLRAMARTGDVMVHPPHTPFSEHADTPGTHQWIAFDAHIGETIPRDLLAHYPLPLVLPLGDDRSGEYAARFAEFLLHNARSANNSHEMLAELQSVATASQLLAILISVWQDSGAPARPDALLVPQARFGELVAHMGENLHKPLGRDDLARIACLHPGSLDRAFRACHGIAPMQMLRELRLERARRLLETTDDTLETIGAQVGLGDAARLSRAFRVRFGLAPGAYRNGAKRAKVDYIPPQEKNS